MRTRITTSPQAVDLDSPGRRDYSVKFEHPTLWAQYMVPLTVLVGPAAAPGRGLVAIGSTHGNEYEGPVAIKHLLNEIDVNDVLGRIILIPVLNVAAFQAGVRDTPDDGMNLNRAFPGNAGGPLTSRFADFVTRFVFPRVHVVIDIHAGGEVARFPPTISFHPVEDGEQRKAMETTARGFGAPFTMIYQDDTPGLLTSTAEQMGKITLGSELGHGAAVDATGVSIARQGILTAAAGQGLVSTPAPANAHCPDEDQVLIDTSDPESSLLAPYPGHFEPVVQLGVKVGTGDAVGYLHDFGRIDETPLLLTAPHEGYVCCQAWRAPVMQGQVLTQVGREVAWHVNDVEERERT